MSWLRPHQKVGIVDLPLRRCGHERKVFMGLAEATVFTFDGQPPTGPVQQVGWCPTCGCLILRQQTEGHLIQETCVVPRTLDGEANA